MPVSDEYRALCDPFAGLGYSLAHIISGVTEYDYKVKKKKKYRYDDMDLGDRAARYQDVQFPDHDFIIRIHLRDVGPYSGRFLVEFRNLSDGELAYPPMGGYIHSSMESILSHIPLEAAWKMKERVK